MVIAGGGNDQVNVHMKSEREQKNSLEERATDGEGWAAPYSHNSGFNSSAQGHEQMLPEYVVTGKGGVDG